MTNVAAINPRNNNRTPYTLSHPCKKSFEEIFETFDQVFFLTSKSTRIFLPDQHFDILKLIAMVAI